MAYAVVDPWAVMVHLEDTEATLTAVVSPCWLPGLLAFALLASLDLHVLRLKWCGHSFLDPAWVRTRRSQVSKNRQGAHSIERDEVEESLRCQGNALYEH